MLTVILLVNSAVISEIRDIGFLSTKIIAHIVETL